MLRRQIQCIRVQCMPDAITEELTFSVARVGDDSPRLQGGDFWNDAGLSSQA